MSYFSNHYSEITYPLSDANNKGLRNAQIGAIGAINSHFSVHEKEPAIVVMPTGSGKTAVLYLSCYCLRASRVLIITPSRLVRNQIAEGFSNLEVLINNKVVEENIIKPNVYEVTHIISGQESWDNLKIYDVIVSAPNSLIGGSNPFNPPEDLFDLVLIDEAHHSPANTWDLILKHFKKAKKILFTATPFRRDQKEIKGKIVFNYPITKAFEDRIFGEVQYAAVHSREGQNNDVAIAIKAAQIFQQDKNNGLDHYIMVRTHTKKHAKELIKVYEDNTRLKLKRIDSTMPSRTIKHTIKQLSEKQIDGIICVDMLGEGFDFPNLKIAAIHNPHKSLAITLQFIGRFARTNTDNVGTATFIAIPNDIEFYKIELYKEGAIWRNIIKDISENAIQAEVEIRETFSKFETKDLDLEDDTDISLYSLKPYYHVKIYDVTTTVDITKELKIPGNIIEKHLISEELSTAVLITKEMHKPKWIINDDLIDVKYNLFVIYYDAENNLLYINASRKTIDIYNEIATQLLGDKPKKLPLSYVHKVLLDFNDTEVFNLGLRNKNALNNSESYIIKSGAHVQNSIKTSEVVSYEGGHTFIRGKESNNNDFETIGYSSSSKVWSNTTSKITDFISWCKKLSTKIISERQVITNTDLDRITIREVYSFIPEDIVFASWHSKCFKENIQYYYSEGELQSNGSLIDLEIKIIHEETNNQQITYIVTNGQFEEKFHFTLQDFHTRNRKTITSFVIVDTDGEEIEIESALNEEYPIAFFIKDFSSIVLNEISKSRTTGVNYDASRIMFLNWSDTDIDCEFSGNSIDKLNIHDKLKEHLSNQTPPVLIYDHGTGEMADFVMFTESSQNIIVDFYHCKGAGGKLPGNRVGDVYEVCGQSIKSCYYASPKELIAKIAYRTTRDNPSEFIFGDFSVIEQMMAKNKILKFNIIAVQPGIPKNGLQSNISEVLAAAENYIDRGDHIKFGILGSENI